MAEDNSGKLDIVQEANAFRDAVKAGQPIPEDHPATTAAALGMATNMGSMEPAPLFSSGFKAGVSREAAQAYGTAAESSLGPLQRVQKTLGHEVTPQGQVLDMEKAELLLQDANAAHDAGILSTEDLQRVMQHHGRAQRRGYAEGGEITLDSATAPIPTDTSTSSVIKQPLAATSSAVINVFNPEGNLVSIPHDTLVEAQDMGYRPASPEEVHTYAHQQKYGTPGQQFKAGLEGLAEGVAGPLAPMAEKALGVNPEDIRGREEVNPLAHGAGEAAGLVGGAFLPGSQAHLLEEAGTAVRGAMGAGKATFISQVGPEAVKSAAEMALFQAGEEFSKKFKEDPTQTVESAIHDIGLAGVIGGVFGGPIGAALQKAKYAGLELPTIAEPQFVSQVDRDALEAGHLETSIRHSDHLPDHDKEGFLAGLLDRTEKSESPEIRAAAKRLGIEPLEGMVSANKWVQKAEDSLINGAPTYSGVRRARLYNEVYSKAGGAAEEALGESSRYTKAELGDIMKKSISEQIEEQNAPIKAMYDELKAGREVIPLTKDAAKELEGGIKELQELRVSPSSPEGQLAKRILRESSYYKTVDDLQLARSMLNRSISPTASSGEKRMAGILADKLTQLEETSIEKQAKRFAATDPVASARIELLIDQRKAANAKYKEFINKVQTLSEQLGKGRVYGKQDALNFINERLTPEEIVQKLGTNKDSTFRKFFAKEYPEQHELMREYQKGALREKASATGTLSPKVLFNNINKLEPEIQKSIFSPAELQKLKDSETIIRSIPKDFNPSGTSHTMATRDFFIHPKGAALSNARDFAMEKFIKGVGNAPEVAKAVKLAKASISGDRLASRAVQAIFNKGAMPLAAIPVIANREKLAKMVNFYAANPDKMFQQGDNNPLPQYAQGFSATSARAIQYLAAMRPNTDPKAPLDRKVEVNPIEKAKYNNALDIAQQPLSVLNKMYKGMLTPDDLNALKAIYPSTYKDLQQKITASVVEAKQKDHSLPYQSKLMLSAFLGQPLDSSMDPSSIVQAQLHLVGNKTPVQNPPAVKTQSLQKLSESAMTAGQARSSEMARGK